MKCVAIDDEPLALSVIDKFCQRVGGLELKTFSDPVDGLDYVRKSVPDILFLDIEMNGVSGLDIARELPKGTFLIFTTAYAEFALDGFELNAVDFLHKPFSFGCFTKAVEKAFKLKELYDISSQAKADGADIVVKVEYQNVRIPLSAIQYVEAMDNYVKIHTSELRPIVTQMSLKSISEMLPEKDFFRIHKSYIVAVNKIDRFTRNKVTMTCRQTELPVGRVYANDFIEYMKNRE